MRVARCWVYLLLILSLGFLSLEWGVLRSVNWGQGGGEEGLGQSCIWVRGCAKSAHPAGCCQARSCPFKCPSRCRDLWNQEPRASRRPGVTSATLG